MYAPLHDTPRSILTFPALSFYNVNDSDTAELLRPDEHNFFSDNLSPFYDHVMRLLSTIEAHTHIVDFAKLALQAHAQARPEPRALGNGEPDKKAQVTYPHCFHIFQIALTCFLLGCIYQTPSGLVATSLYSRPFHLEFQRSLHSPHTPSQPCPSSHKPQVIY